MGGSGIFGASGSTGTGGTYGAQSRNPYATSYTPSAVYGGGGAAPAPAPAAALTPQAALGPLGPAAITAAQNTTFGETQLGGVGPIYKKQDSLEPVRCPAQSLSPLPPPGCCCFAGHFICSEHLSLFLLATRGAVVVSH
jgi:hypothetical protein